jgi:hypothetical protein
MSVNNWIIRKIKGIDKERMKKHIDIIAKNSNKSKLYIKIDIFINFLTRGIGYTDYFRGDYINLTKKEKDTFITTKSFYKIIKYLNNEKYEALLNDKLVFNKYFNEYIKRDYINLRECTVKDFEKFLLNKEVVFAKTPIGEGGHGVSKIVIKDYSNKKKLYNTLVKRKQYLVEEAIIQSKDLNEINPNVVNSFRIVTLYKDNEAYVINNALRINQDDTDVIGCTNDLYFSLNEDGIIDSNVIDDYANVYETHPLTGKKFSEVKIKGVKEAFEMCKQAAKKIPEVRYIGWDVAFTENGPVIVEGNEYPGYGLLQFYKLKNKKTGHLKEISDILGDEMKNIKL